MTSNDRRAEILQTAAELFASEGIGATTVRDIGQRAGVLSGSLYHYFPSKHAMVSEILADYMHDIHERFSAVARSSTDPEPVVRGLITETLRVIDEHPHPTAIYQQDRQYLRKHGLLGPVDESSRAVRSYWMDAIRQGAAEGTFREDVPAETFYRTVRDSLWASMHWPGRSQHPTAGFAEMMGDLFLGGFAAPARGQAVAPPSTTKSAPVV